MFNTYPTLEAYLAQCDEDNNRERIDRELRNRALTDRALQCEHLVSLYSRCDRCPSEADLAENLGETP